MVYVEGCLVLCDEINWLLVPPDRSFLPSNQTLSPCEFTLINQIVPPIMNPLAWNKLVQSSSHGSHGAHHSGGLGKLLFAGVRNTRLSAWSPDLFGEVGSARRWSFFWDFDRRVA